LKAWKLFDADIGKDSAREVREYFIPSFEGWQNEDIYREKLLHLVAGLAIG
jgi:hypothetical protein